MKCTIICISFTDSVAQWSVWAMSTTLHKAGKPAHGWKQKLQADPSSHEKTHLTFKELDYFRDLISVDSHLCVFCDWVLLIKKLFSNEFSAHSSDHCTNFLHIIDPVFLCFVIFPLYIVYMYKCIYVRAHVELWGQLAGASPLHHANSWYRTRVFRHASRCLLSIRVTEGHLHVLCICLSACESQCTCVVLFHLSLLELGDLALMS